MMAQAGIVSTEYSARIALTVDNHSTFAGQSIDDHTVYDLTGTPAQNSSRMAGSGTTRTRWEGDRLITDWQNAGAVPGSTVSRIETRFLSADGQTMTLESARPGKPAVVMVFDRDQ